MKKILLAIYIIFSGTLLYAQNTFPSSGNVGIGTAAPISRLDIRGRVTIDNGGNAAIFTGIGNRELNRYLAIFNSTEVTSASGVKAGGMLVADDYTYSDPGKSDLVVKGAVGIGTPRPTNKLDVRGNVTIDNGKTGAGIYTGTGTVELNRYLSVFNSTGLNSASGVKAGGMLVANDYTYANPGKNDLIVKGYVGVGTPKPTNKLDVRGHITMEAGRNPTIFTGVGTQELNRYLTLINSTGLGSASGLKAGGILIADAYNYADPAKSDLVVKGSVSIGTPTSQGYKLAVNGTIRAKEIKVESANWPDYVFGENYDLRSLSEVEQFVKANKHLPGIPDQEQVEKEGVNLGEMNRKLLEKVEELTLHLIDEQKARLAMEKEIAALKGLVERKK